MSAHPREYEVILPIGHTDDTGRRSSRAMIRKLRGHEEALLFDPALSGARLITEIIRGGLCRIGDLPEVTSEVVSRLYSADRAYLLVELRRITLGDELVASYLCPGCGGEVRTVENLAELEVKRLPEGERADGVTVTLEDGYRDRDGELHTDVHCRLPRGVDEEFVAGVAERDPLRARDVLLLRCIESFGRLPRATLESYGYKILRDLTIGDRHRLFRAIDTDAPGVSLRRSARCNHCGVRFETVLEASGFFVAG